MPHEHVPTLGEFINFILFGSLFMSFVALNLYHFICRLFDKED